MAAGVGMWTGIDGGRETRELSEVTVLLYILVEVRVSRGAASAKTYQMVHIRFVYFTICKFYHM